MAILLIPLIVIGLMLIAVMVIPITASMIASAILGKVAKQERGMGLVLAFVFYFFMWLFFWLYLCGSNDAGILSAIGYLLAALIWPLPIGYVMLGVTTDASNSAAWLVVIAAFIATQCVAVLMVISDAKKALDRDKSLDKYDV